MTGKENHYITRNGYNMKSFNKLFLQLLEIVTDKERSNVLTAEKTAEIIERDGSVVTGFVVTDKYGNVGIIDKGAVRWIDKAKFHNMMHNEIEFNGDDLVKSVESFAKTI